MDLNRIMEFDHVVQVLDNGTVIDGPPGIYAPTMLDDKLDDNRWALLSGWSGQYGYSGPTMHSSEYIGGNLAEHIQSMPGLYVAIVSDHTCQEHDDCDCDGVDGWGIAYWVARVPS